MAADTLAADVAVIGAGHNGLVAATLLARQGLRVLVLEEKDAVGGAAKTEYPFARVPTTWSSTGAYLLGLVPPELLERLGAVIPFERRDPHYFLPTFDKQYLLFGSDAAASHRQFLKCFSDRDWLASRALERELAAIRDDLAPSWLQEPVSLEETAVRFVRPALRRTFVDLVTRPVDEYLARFGFESDLVLAMYAVTDGFSGLYGSFGDVGTGLNFLIHNMCRLPGADGTWMRVAGGMGAVTKEFARLAGRAGARVITGSAVEHIVTTGGRVTGVTLSDGREVHSTVIVCGTDPFRMRRLVGASSFSAEFNERLDAFTRPGTTMKVNLALDRLPTFACLPENRGQHNGTIHLMPQGPDVLRQIRDGFDRVRTGELADFPTIEWYIQSPHGAPPFSSAFFVQWVPYELSHGSWENEEAAYVQHLFEIADRFAPGFSASVIDTFTLTPKKIEQHFGISYGHIHHVDNSFGFDRRMPYATPIDGLYCCSAGCHPAGAVIGAAGHNAALRILHDLGMARS